MLCGLLLAIALFATAQFGKRLGFSREDRITILFCGSKKSLASGVPMANVLFASSAVGAIVLPLMLFHQIQLMVCAVLAQRYALAGERSRQPIRLPKPSSTPRTRLVARREPWIAVTG